MAWIDSLFHKMVEKGASDLHLTSGRVPMFRMDGDIVPVEGGKVMSPDQLETVLLEIASIKSRKEFEDVWDTDFAYEIKDVGRFRCNLFMDHHGPGGVFRAIPSKILTFKDLGLPPALEQFCHLSKGLVLVTGPTGSGKSTTLAAMIDLVNKTRSDHIITIEDPVEFLHKDQRCLVNQREVGRHTKSFKSALRAALREDPDIMLVGELRDLETVEIAIETAETGHLVFGTLHTTTAASTIDRIIDQFSADRQAQIRTMLSTSLRGVVAQTLCKKKGGGRVAALEVLVANNAISSQIRDGKTHQIANAMQTGARTGMRLMNDSLAELVQQGQVEPAEAYMKAVDKDALMTKFRGMGIRFDPIQMAQQASAAANAVPQPGAKPPAGAPQQPTGSGPAGPGPPGIPGQRPSIPGKPIPGSGGFKGAPLPNWQKNQPGRAQPAPPSGGIPGAPLPHQQQPQHQPPQQPQQQQPQPQPPAAPEAPPEGTISDPFRLFKMGD